MSAELPRKVARLDPATASYEGVSKSQATSKREAANRASGEVSRSMMYTDEGELIEPPELVVLHLMRPSAKSDRIGLFQEDHTTACSIMLETIEMN